MILSGLRRFIYETSHSFFAIGL